MSLNIAGCLGFDDIDMAVRGNLFLALWLVLGSRDGLHHRQIEEGVRLCAPVGLNLTVTAPSGYRMWFRAYRAYVASSVLE